jgi:prepilin-type N-terminal cleavage/methylation domain-containing protein
MTKGYTLIELLIVVAIVLIFTGLSLAYYNQYTDETTLRSEAKQVIDVIELAKKKASSSDTEGDNICVLSDYRLVVAAPNKYSLQWQCAGDASPSTVKEYTLANGLSFGGDITIIFKPMTAGVSFEPSGQNQIDIRHLGLDKHIAITVSSAGIVTERAPETIL